MSPLKKEKSGFSSTKPFVNRHAVAVALFLLVGIAGVLFAEQKPEWVDGTSPQYPDASYMVGVGFGDTRQGAENSAYTALARVFKAQVRSSTREQEDFRQREEGGKTETGRKIDIQGTTEVSTEKVLEQVRIAERWVDPVSKVQYALAVLDRAKAASDLRRKSTAAEMEAKEWEGRAKKASDKLQRARALRKAILAARLNEGYEADLRIIQPMGGDAGAALVSSSALNDQLSLLLDEHFRVGVHITGPRADAVRDAILAGLHEKGFTSGSREDIVVGGDVGFEEVDLKDPKWHYVRWTAHLTLTEKETGKVFGSLTRSGREGQLSRAEADRKALVALQTEMTETVGETLLKFIFGE